MNPEIRTQPVESVRGNSDWGQNHYLNCPRCGADNRNWLSISSQIRPLRAPHIITGAFLSFLLVALILVSRWSELFQDRLLAVTCLILAAALPLLIIPGQWRALRDYHLVQRFLPMLPQGPLTPTLRTTIMLYLIIVIGIPGFRYGLMPIVSQTISSTVTAISETESNKSEITGEDVADELGFFMDWLYLGTLTSIVSSAFALLGVGQVLGGVNNQLPRPIYSNTANMVRVVLWEAKRALEINGFFERIQWTMTRRNEQGGIDMEGSFRDPPEILASGRLEELVRVQKYYISTDRWCVITKAEIVDTKSQRPAGELIDPLEFFAKSATTPITVGRPKDE